MTTAEKVRLLRIERGLTQEELGHIIGVQKSAINKYEKGRVVNIKRSTLQKLADALGVAPVDLLDDDESLIVNEDGNIIAASEVNRSNQKKLLLYYFSLLDDVEADALVTLAKSLAGSKKG